ncbi:MAG: isocitrate lyase/phosphoenolpyruvate mutase family protein [Pseudomonadota bacterium]
MTTTATAFADLHVAGEPLVLYNVWDAGSAQAVAAAGAKAIATGSASVAAAQGFADGERLPLDDLERTVRQIAVHVSQPVSVDLEGGYGRSPEVVAATAVRLASAGAVGCNFEDQIVGGDGIYSIDEQRARINAIAEAVSGNGLGMHINARTDLFLKESDERRHADLISAAVERAVAYREAGAGSFFVPWLADLDLIANLCDRVALPVNVMMRDGMPGIAELAAAGVARISYGPGPHRRAMAQLTADAAAIFGAA